MPRVASGFDDDDDDPTPCPECGAEVPAITDFCPKCGYWLVAGDREAMKLRSRTGAEMRIVKIGAVVLLVAVVLSAIIAAGVSLWAD